MGEAVSQLTAHLADLHDLNMAYWLLEWDMNTHMPPGGASARARHVATLKRLRHELLTSDETARLIEDAARETAGMDFDSFEASLVRVAQRDYQEALKLPTAFVGELVKATAGAHEHWVQARKTNNFSLFAPSLQRILDLKLQEAEYVGYPDTPYDAMMRRYEPGLTTAQVKHIFDEHKPALIALTAAVGERENLVDDSMLHQPFDSEAQRAFALFVGGAFGFDFQRGRLDVSPHPFCLQIARSDVRLTTRFNPDFFNPALFGMMHETGHGLHAQGYSPQIDGTFLSDMELNSMAVAESQSRLWENLVGRSHAFWTWAFPHAQRFFPTQFGSTNAESLYRAINKARRQFIRVEADELTYNLHIMLRFELENEMVAGTLAVADVPEAWKARFEQFFGIVPPTDSVGVLQDIHWSMGGIGAFHGYALGNLLSVQYFNQALKQHPNLPDEIAQGKFDTLLGWLTENIYQHGRKYTVDELTRRVTGESIQSRDYVAYLQAKFSDLYDL